MGAFGMCTNYAIVTRELASHYFQVWSSSAEAARLAPMSEALRRRVLDEKTQRLNLAAKAMFVWNMSSIEYACKEALKTHPSVIPAANAANRDLKFRQVIDLSPAHGLIDVALLPLWRGANSIRNRMVHNNGIGNEDRDWTFSSALTIQMRAGQEIRGSLLVFPLLTTWVIEQYTEWCDRFYARALSNPAASSTSP